MCATMASVHRDHIIPGVLHPRQPGCGSIPCHPVPSRAVPCRAMPCCASSTGAVPPDRTRAGSRAISALWQLVGCHHLSQPRSCPHQAGPVLVPASGGRAGAVAGVWPLGWPRSQRPLRQLCLSPVPARVFLPQVPSAIPIKGCILLPSLLLARARRCQEPCPPEAGASHSAGAGGAHPGAGRPFPTGIQPWAAGAHPWITPGGWEPHSCASDSREQRCRAEKPQCPGVSWAGGPRSPEPPGSAGLGKGEGTEPPPRAPAGPCPLGWGSRSSSSRPDTRLPAAEAVP